jgi:hypothetical protein
LLALEDLPAPGPIASANNVGGSHVGRYQSYQSSSLSRLYLKAAPMPFTASCNLVVDRLAGSAEHSNTGDLRNRGFRGRAGLHQLAGLAGAVGALHWRSAWPARHPNTHNTSECRQANDPEGLLRVRGVTGRVASTTILTDRYFQSAVR